VISQTAVALCEDATPRQEEFLLTVLRAEMAQREVNRRKRLVVRAGFPAYKTLEGFDRHGVKLPSTLSWADLEAGTFIPDHRNLVLFGAVGTGKSHCAIALGYAACERGLTVRFFPVTDLVMRLSAAKRAGTVDRLLHDLQRAALLILDEWGYVPVDHEGAQLLFQVIADSYETRSLIITTNLEFSKWGSVLTDEQMTAAIIDRLAHHGHLMVFAGESYRMKHALMRER
jgi:DNA replication protein DnaC